MALVLLPYRSCRKFGNRALKKLHQVSGLRADQGKTAREQLLAAFMELIHDKAVEFSDNNRHGRPILILDKVRIGVITRRTLASQLGEVLARLCGLEAC